MIKLLERLRFTGLYTCKQEGSTTHRTATTTELDPHPAYTKPSEQLRSFTTWEKLAQSHSKCNNGPKILVNPYSPYMRRGIGQHV